MRAIISVDNRDGLIELAQELRRHDVTIFATGGTLKALQAGGIEAESVSGLTQFPEILDGRVKTLHPAILGGILARRELPSHQEELQTHNMAPIDIVVSNLYPFAKTVAQADVTLMEALEKIDIGGVTLTRAAAKNFQDVLILTRPEDYTPVMQEWHEQGEVSLATRRHLAAIALQQTASYDTTIAEYLRSSAEETFAPTMTIPLERVQTLRYGENPHQQAAFYRWSGTRGNDVTTATVADAEVLHGKELSFNNFT